MCIFQLVNFFAELAADQTEFFTCEKAFLTEVTVEDFDLEVGDLDKWHLTSP
jgi:hypothetical protein